MIFQQTQLVDARLVELQPRVDERGFFARAWCSREFAEAGLDMQVAQINLSGSKERGTLRGLHYQLPPAAEAKFVRCIQGTILDVIVDIRPDSPTYLKWQGFELSAENRMALYVPHGFAHGFQSLTDDVELIYLASAFYSPELERGVRFDDPAVAVEWPMEPTVLSEKDGSWPDYSPSDALRGLVRLPAETGEEGGASS